MPTVSTRSRGYKAPLVRFTVSNNATPAEPLGEVVARTREEALPRAVATYGDDTLTLDNITPYEAISPGAEGNGSGLQNF